jgi:hypothetical protein
LPKRAAGTKNNEKNKKKLSKPEDLDGLESGGGGARLMVSPQTVISIENGQRDPSLRVAFAISKLFSESIETIFPDRR